MVKDPWFWTVSLFPDTALPRSVRFEERNRFRAEATSPKVLQYVPENPEERVEWDVRILDAKPDYVVATSFEWDDEQRLAKIADLPPAIRAGVERKAARFEPESSVRPRSKPDSGRNTTDSACTGRMGR